MPERDTNIEELCSPGPCHNQLFTNSPQSSRSSSLGGTPKHFAFYITLGITNTLSFHELLQLDLPALPTCSDNYR